MALDQYGQILFLKNLECVIYCGVPMRRLPQSTESDGIP